MTNQFGDNYQYNGDLITRGDRVIGNINDIVKYYITDNHSAIETAEHFGITKSMLTKIQNHYGIKKPKILSHEHNKKTCLKLYGNENYNNIEQNKKTCLERYGVENVYQSEIIKQRLEQTKLERYGHPRYTNVEKRIQTNLERYGATASLKNPEVQAKARQTCKEHYGVEYPMQAEEVRAKYNFKESAAKAFQTKKKHGTTNTSKIQKWFINELKLLYGEDDVFEEYKEKRYPYHCDAYIKSQDLFIELNIFFTHGGHPFNNSNPEDLHKMELWEEKSKTSDFFKAAINVWTNLDAEKITCAQNNQLNYLIFYTNAEAEQYIKELKEKHCND